MNVMSNSTKFTFQGYIKISVTKEIVDNTEFISIVVQDTGIGIKKEDQHKIFKLFGMMEDYKNDSKFPLMLTSSGWGIGLTVSKKYIDFLNGSINLQSVFDIGTTMIIRIPLIRSNIHHLQEMLFDYQDDSLSRQNNLSECLVQSQDISDNSNEIQLPYKFRDPMKPKLIIF